MMVLNFNLLPAFHVAKQRVVQNLIALSLLIKELFVSCKVLTREDPVETASALKFSICLVDNCNLV